MMTPVATIPGASPRLRQLALILGALFLAGCSITPPSNVKSNAQLTPSSRITRDLTQLPKPKTKTPVAVYGFRDQTGQFKPSPDSSYSTSVTQGAAAMLVKALKDSDWYIPVEREGLQNLLTERKIVRAIESSTEKGKPLVNLPNLMPASLIIEGGVIAYESNVRTGGKGANYLGVGASTQYRVDQVTVSLRSIDIRNGQVLDTVSVTKTIYSYQFSASIYKFTSFQHLLQGESGYTTNEPAQLAVREAIESAVVHLTVQGVRDRYLELRDERAFNLPIMQTYLKEIESNLSEDGIADDAPVSLRALSADTAGAVVLPLIGPAESPPVRPPAAPAMSPAAPAVASAAGDVPKPVAPLPAAPVAPAVVPASASKTPVAPVMPTPAGGTQKPVASVAQAVATPVVVKPTTAPAAQAVATPVVAKSTSAPAAQAVAAPVVAKSASAPVAPSVSAPVAVKTPAAPVTPTSVAAPATSRPAVRASTPQPGAGKKPALPSDDIFKQYWKNQDGPDAASARAQ